MVAVGVSVGAGVDVSLGGGVPVAGAVVTVTLVFDARGLHPTVMIKTKTKIADTFRIPACTSLGFKSGGFPVMGLLLP